MYMTKFSLVLVLIMMDFADYRPRQTLEVPHDPLHPTNRKALGQYLEHCWQIIVRCDMMMKELRMSHWSWDSEVGDQVSPLWDSWRCPFGTLTPTSS